MHGDDRCIAVDSMCASRMHELAWPHCLGLDALRFYDCTKYAFIQQKAVSINAMLCHHKCHILLKARKAQPHIL